jgi:hypothetical protein
VQAKLKPSPSKSVQTIPKPETSRLFILHSLYLLSNPKGTLSTLTVGQSLVIPTRHTNGTLVEGNLAQCKSVISTDTDFHAPDSSIVAGQYALAAIDGSNATAWQPVSNATSTYQMRLMLAFLMIPVVKCPSNTDCGFAKFAGNLWSALQLGQHSTPNIHRPCR